MSPACSPRCASSVTPGDSSPVAGRLSTVVRERDTARNHPGLAPPLPDPAPLRLTRSLLAFYRPGALVAVALGLAADVPLRRPRGHALHARGMGGGLVAQLVPHEAEPRSAVAVVEVRGVLEQRCAFSSCGETDGYDAIEQRFAEAAADPAVGALVLDIDTPGGDVPGVEETGRRMRALATRLGKPVLAFANEKIASAGFWLGATVAEGIYLPPSGRLGSIGTCCVHASEARLLEREGIDVYVARDPDGKMRPNDVEPLDELGKARLDNLAKNGTARFVAAMSERRRVLAEELRKLDGEMLEGAEAVRAGLADGIGTLEETIALAASLAALKRSA